MKDYPSTCRSWNRFVSVFLAHFCAGKRNGRDWNFTVNVQSIASSNDIPSALDFVLKDADGLLIVMDHSTVTAMQLVGDKAREANVLLVGGSKDMIEDHGLATYGNDYLSLGEQTSPMVIRQMEERTGQKNSLLNMPKT